MPSDENYDAIVMATAHREFTTLGAKAIRVLGPPGTVLADVQGVFAKDESDGRL